MGDWAALRHFRRLFRQALWLLSLVLVFPSAAGAAPHRIVAVGDLHGDFSAWQDIARDAGLIDPAGHWSGGATILVQMGDILDRGGDALKIVRSLQQLQREAPRRGGKVFVLLGNHEAMNLLGDFRYTTPGEFAAFASADSAARREAFFQQNQAAIAAALRAKDPKLSPQQVHDAWILQTPLGWVEHRAAWSATGELGKWATRNPAVLSLDGTLFVHGGISNELARLPITEVNRRVATAMASADDSDRSILNDPIGPLWYRGLVMRDPDAEAARTGEPGARLTSEQEVDAVLAAYGARRMVIAHTPNLSGILITDSGKLARIDTGNSRYYGGTLSWLEIVDGRMAAHTVRRSRQ